ncbi:hypothetical protein G9A89_021566 [Geosiphon pyriformis]|nr:hypothetical protein G9A89_021566 [Geosiphon pyriformis]
MDNEEGRRQEKAKTLLNHYREVHDLIINQQKHGKRIRMPVSYAESPTSTLESETDSDYIESKKCSSSLAGSSNSVQQSNPQETSDLVTDDDRVEKVQMSNMNFNRFTEEFQKMENNKKWSLASQKVVEDEFYKFGMRCRYEQ